MSTLVKNNDTTFLPILLGTDANSYGMARSFHEAYGITSLALGKFPLLETKHSKIVRVETREDFENDEIFLQTLHKVYETYKDLYKNLILIACGDRYTELLTLYKEKLSPYFHVPYINNQLKNQLEDKVDFYNMCKIHGLDYPKTYLVTKETKDEISLPFDYPVAIKANNSISYVLLDFKGKKKAYKANTKKEMQEIVDLIYRSGYEDTLIIQDFIPGDASMMYVLNAYSNEKGKVQTMCLGHVVIEDKTPHGIGNYNAIIQEANQELYEKYQAFLEKIGFVGFSNFDLKYDERDKTFKVFEINIRQGRSSFFTTASGCNLAKYLINDRINQIELPTPHYHNNPHLWLHVPKKVALKLAPSGLKETVRDYIKQKKYTYTLLYKKDKGLYRSLRIKRFYKIKGNK